MFVWWLLLLAILAWPSAARAQTDPCTASLPYQADPLTKERFSLRCEVEILQQERAAEANQRSKVEVQASVEAAYAKNAQDALDAKNAEMSNTKDYWKRYIEGLRFTPELASALAATCAHGGENEIPRVCKLWHKR